MPSASIKTLKPLKLDEVVDDIVGYFYSVLAVNPNQTDENERVYITPDEILKIRIDNESYKIGWRYNSLRGIEIQNEGDDFIVRLATLGSKGDYSLFKEAVIGILKLGEGEALLNYEHSMPDSDAARSFRWEAWTKYVMEEEFRELSEYISQHGESKVYQGIIMPFVVGPRLLNAVEMKPDKLLETLTAAQWAFQDTPRSQQGQLGNEDTRERISLTIFDKARPIDGRGMLLPWAAAFAIGDSKKGSLAIMRFRHARDVFSNALPIDEEQVFIPAELTHEEKESVDNLTTVFTERNVFKDPVMPGCGFDEQQNTFVLLWNPDTSSVKMDDFDYWMKMMRAESSNWGVAEHEKVEIGDRWFLIACGNNSKKGIVASGIFDSNPWMGENHNGKEAYYCDLLPNVLVDPVKGDLISVAELSYRMPNFEWDATPSGKMLPDDYARELETLWHSYLKKHKTDPESNHMRIMD